jgi:prophage regulatory protein
MWKLSKRQVKELVLYSPQPTARLEKAGLFPNRIQLGPNRVGWVESEVLEWLEKWFAQREGFYRKVFFLKNIVLLGPTYSPQE